MLSLRLIAPILSIAAILIGAVAHFRCEERILRSTLFLLTIPLFSLAWLTIWIGLNLYSGDREGVIVFCLANLTAAAVVLTRFQIRKQLLALPRAIRLSLGILAVISIAALSFLSLELPLAQNGGIKVLPKFSFIEILIIFLVLSVILFIFQKHGASLIVGTTSIALIGVASAFVASFRNSAILPGDLLVLGTAAAVAGNYSYSFTTPMLNSLACWLLTIPLAILIHPELAKGEMRRGHLGANAICACSCTAVLAIAISQPAIWAKLDINLSYWDTLGSYRTYGFIPSFITAWHDLSIEQPEGYSDKDALALETNYASTYDNTRGASRQRALACEQFSGLRPSIVYVVNESFADLSTLADVDWGYTGPERYNSISDALVRGDLVTSTAMGGTSNSEFELLTGVSLGFVGEGKFPFTSYDLSESPSVVRQLKDLGYETTAMHPNLSTNYNRENAYPELGFDIFLSDEDFVGADTYHSGVSDEETYDKVLQILEEGEAPQFIYDLTMQNHSGYNLNNIGNIAQYSVEGLTSEQNAELSEYLACIEESDRALLDFINDLRGIDRPVVLVFVGDHQPVCAKPLNNTLNSTDGSFFEHDIRHYETTYTVWANYDISGLAQDSPQKTSSFSYITAQTLELIGAPLTDFQKAQLLTSEELPAISLVAIRDTEDSWHPLEQANSISNRYADLEVIAYLEFGSKL